MAKGVKEREFQNKLIEWSLPLGWHYAPGRSLPREFSETVLVPHLRDAVVRLNPDVIDGYDVDALIADVTSRIARVDGGLVAANEKVLTLLRGRIEFRDREGRWHALRFIDLEHPHDNTLLVADEVTISVAGARSRRFDVVYFVNGLPLVVVEVKSPTAKSGWADAAKDVNDTYVAEYPWFFTPNVFVVASDGLKLRFGAAGSPVNLWQPFRSTNDDEHLEGMADTQRSAELLLAPANVLDYLLSFCLFDTEGDGVDIKYVARYPQKEAAHLVHQRVVNGGSKGLIWHHQGSGKTLLMAYAASLLLNDTRAKSPTIILLSDRNHLVRQTAHVAVATLGKSHYYAPATGAALRALLRVGEAGVISTTIHKFADAGKNLSERDNIVVLVDEAHRTHSTQENSLASQMRAALPNAKFFGMTGTPVRNLNTDTFALFGDRGDRDGVLHHYSVTRSLGDEATVPVLFESHPVGFDLNERALQEEFDKFADANDLDDDDRETLSRKFGRLTSVFANPGRVEEVCQHIVDHYLSTVFVNGMKAQVVTYNRELAVAYTDKINHILSGFEVTQYLADMGRDPVTAEVNISVRDSKDEDARFRPYLMSEADEEEQKRRFLTPTDPLSFLVVTAKLMTGFDAPNEGVLYLDKPLTKHTLFQTMTRPNRTWVAPSGFVKTRGVVIDYVGLGDEVQGVIFDPSVKPGQGSAVTFVQDKTELVAEFRATIGRVDDLLAGVPGLDLNRNDFESLRLVSAFLDGHSDAAEVFMADCRLLTKLYPYVADDSRTNRYRQTFALLTSVYGTLFKQFTDDERRERLAELGPMVVAIINDNVRSFKVMTSQEQALTLDQVGIAALKELLIVLTSPNTRTPESDQPPSAKEILDRIKAMLDDGLDERSVKYVALAKRIKNLRERIIQGASDALDFLSEALRIAKTIVDAEKSPELPLLTDEDHIGVLSRIIAEHAPLGLTVTERNLAAEIDEVVTRTLAGMYDNAQARSRAVRRSAAWVFRRYALKPVGEPYDSTVEYIEAHYLID